MSSRAESTRIVVSVAASAAGAAAALAAAGAGVGATGAAAAGAAAAAAGIAPVTVARAALLGVHTTGFPVSPLTPATFLVVGLSEISLAQHQRFSIPFLFGASLVMTAAAVAFGLIPI